MDQPRQSIVANPIFMIQDWILVGHDLEQAVPDRVAVLRETEGILSVTSVWPHGI